MIDPVAIAREEGAKVLHYPAMNEPLTITIFDQDQLRAYTQNAFNKAAEHFEKRAISSEDCGLHVHAQVMREFSAELRALLPADTKEQP